MQSSSHISLKALIGVLILIVTAGPCAAQRRRGTELDLLRNESVLSEIGVNDDTIDQLEELRQSTMTTTGVFEGFRAEMRAAKTDEERTAIRQKIRNAVQNGAEEYQQRALELLNERQRKQLRRVFIENYGIYALNDKRVASDLQLTEEQQTSVKALLDERRSIESDDNLNDEDRTASLTESTESILASLSEPQLAEWKQQTSEQEPIAEHPSEASERQSPSPSEQSQGDKTASFGTPGSQSDQTVQRYSFNFRRAPWERVLQLFADGAGLTLDMQRVPPGSLTHLDRKEYSATRALDIINGYLIRKGFGVVRKDGFLVVVNLDEQLDQSLVPEVTLDELKQTGDDKSVGDNQLVTVRINVEGLDTARTAQEIEALLGPWGSMIALTQSQVIMVTDIGANLRRILGLLENAARPDESTFESYHLKNIDVEEAEPLLLTQFGMRQAATNVSAATESGRYRDRRSRDDRDSPPVPPTSIDSLQVASDVRTNSLLVTGTAAQHALVKTILLAIDVGESPNGTPLSRTGRRGKYLSVYDVSSSDAREVTKTLDAIMPGVVVNEDGRNGRIHIMATEREHEEVGLLIRQLDGAGGRQSVAVIALVKMDPLLAASTLRSLFISEGTEAPTIETDLYGRRLIVRGEPDQVAQIKSVLAELGEDGSGIRPPSQNGLRRRYSLQGRSPDDFLRILQDAWQDAEPNPIRIVVPAQSGPVRERRTSDGAVNDSEPETHERKLDDDPSASVDVLDKDYLTVTIQDKPDAAPPVIITVLGDDLLLTSDDPEALDRLEDLLDSLQQTLPYRTRWTIFYLQSADATEAADLLAQIFPSSSVASTAASTGGSILSSLANSFSGVGSSLADATGLGSLGENPQALRIIPDVRSNSLLIAGPDALLQDVWAMLRVLDSDDIPESLREMEQRTITVEHADIRNVAAILRDVFKPLMEVQNSGDRQQENPLAAMFGGASSSAKQQQVRMTLGIDEQTSSLVVSSSQAIFDDVKDLVETLDKNAKDANRKIRVVQLKNADPVLIQRSLTGLFPRVTTSVTSSRTSGNGAESDSDPKRTDETRRQQENRFRDEMIRRFRERGQSGGGGAGPLGGGRARGNGGQRGRPGR